MSKRLEHAKLLQLCPTLCDPMDFSVHEALQAKILEWVAISFSRGSSQPRDRATSLALAGRFFTTEPPGKPTKHSGISDFTPVPASGQARHSSWSPTVTVSDYH